MVHNVGMQLPRLSFFLLTSRAVPRLVRRDVTTHTTLCSGIKPVLVRLLEDGSEVRMNKGEMFKYQRYRWLTRRRDPQHLAARYREFNLENLLETVNLSTDHKGARCVKVSKCMEGQYNKAFVLTMDNGEQLVARLPNPNAGPAFFTTASEVREFLGIPVPRIYAWSTDRSNLVGAEYIIEKKATGYSLGSIWGRMSRSSQFVIIDQVVEIERKLASVSFPMQGCLYYTSDLKSEVPDAKGLDIMLRKLSGLKIEDCKQLSCFAIGPSNDRKLWNDERHSMELNRGPWTNPIHYVTALGVNELNWARCHAKPRMNYYRSTETPENPNEYLALLQRYLDIAPHLCPDYDNINTLSHPDLHLDNIFIDPETHQITSIIDWQLAAITPSFLQHPHPQMLELSLSPGSEEQRSREKELLEYYYKATEKVNPSLAEAFNDPYLSTRVTPINLISGCWEREDTFSLRESLIKVSAYWDQLRQDDTPFPVDFNVDKLAEHERERELFGALSNIVQQLEEEGLIPIGGMVRPEEYEHAKMVSEYFKSEFINLAEDDQQRELHGKVWPY
ncbi:phosphotransferase enzyme family protein [Aspergillus costaricaensis CBS 115574]|uniref:Phosphotransferase enzyme family protein n=1 Tax=Aspergillus costaricaensis CBS 115574 TaxID=1448317 RepID=A0ACD1IPU9_9EURO|nr:phosphotransferase enzyme family protein [Aspergillus costaricaensis CBS 115574]RAK92540.1 phosphotransferase enzyme family protein [Aspergillus costaricaensis CBS 115574]